MAGAYLFWPGWPVDRAPSIAPHPVIHTQSWGQNSSEGNVVGIEPVMTPMDYASEARFEAKLSTYLELAASRDWISNNTIILLPEHIGTGLITVNQSSRAYSKTFSFDAGLIIITRHLIEFAKNYFIFKDPDNLTAALIRTRTRASADAQMRVYSGLAKKYGVTLVAGSSSLMTPGLYKDSLSYGHGPIFNAAFVFGPDGRPQNDAIRKVQPSSEEAGFTKASNARFLPVFDLPNTRKAGVLIGIDSWFDNTVDYAAGQNADLLLVPSFLSNKPWDAPWEGYRVAKPENEGWREDVGTITEEEAWIKYGLPAQAERHGIRWGMTVFLKGELWGQRGHGRALVIEDSQLHIGTADENTPAVYNLWLY